MDKIARILIVDDDPNLLQVHSRLLKSAGYQVVEAGTGQDGLRLAKETGPDLILLDVVLPDIDGITVCRRIKADPALAGSFVILFSGLRIDSKDQAEGLAAGADGYITWPISNQELLARVEALLRIRRAEDALRESEVRFRELFSNMSSGVVVYEVEDGGRNFRIRDINAAGERISKIRREDVVGKSILEVFPGVREFGLFNVLQRVWRTGGPERLPVTQYRDDRLTHWAENYVYKLPSGEVVAVYDDVTERKQVEKAISELARFPGENPNPVLRVARDGTTLYANEAASPVLAAWGCQVNQVLPESWRAFAQQVFNSGSSEAAEVDCGDQVFSLTFAPVVDADYVNVYGLDITDRKQGEAALRESEERFQRAFFDAPFPMMIHAEGGEIIEINRVWTELTGYSHGDIPTIADWTERAYGERREWVKSDIDRLYSLDERVQEGEYVITTRTGERRTWEFSSAPLGHLPDGRRLVMSMAMDVTRRKRVEEALKEYSERLEEMVDERTQELQKAQERLVRREKLAVLGQLAGGVGHELRNPLGVISNAVYFLQMTLADADETTREYLEMIFSEVRNAERIVSGLLDFARTRPPARERVAVSDLVSQALEKCPPPEDVQVTIEIDPDLPRVLVDPRQIEQVLVNLVTNAYQAMSGEGHLAIHADAGEGRVALSIADTGCGIPRKDLEQVFEPLFTTKARGIGLGLAISKSLMEANGGSIEVESEVGRGSIFTVRLPLVRPETGMPAVEK